MVSILNEHVKKLIGKLSDKVRDKPYGCGCLGIATIFLIPVVIWVLYFIGDQGYVLINTSLAVGEALGFYGTFITFLGTMSLTALVIWQSHQNRKKDEAYRALLDRFERDKYMPKFNCSFILVNHANFSTIIRLTVKNDSSNYAYNVVLSDFTFTRGEEKLDFEMLPPSYEIGNMAASNECVKEFTLKPLAIKAPFMLSFYINYKDKFKDIHRSVTSVTCSSINKGRSSKLNMTVEEVILNSTTIHESPTPPTPHKQSTPPSGH